ncbi:MAG: chorismate mutase [Tissierellia bacterium]|nr:chorismate mutase [Tissierellia bacterium]
MKAIRGAITISNNVESEIVKQTEYLFQELVKRNHLKEESIVSVICSCTKDITAAYPGIAIRNLGFNVPVLCVQEQFVEGSLPLCIRILIHTISPSNPSHVYVGKARSLRPDLCEE